MNTVTIYHLPRCSTSRKTLEFLQEKGLEPQVVEYLKTPLDQEGLKALLAKLNISANELVRRKEALFEELQLENANEETLIEAMATHPILMNRPVVVTAKGARLARPLECINDIL